MRVKFLGTRGARQHENDRKLRSREWAFFAQNFSVKEQEVVRVHGKNVSRRAADGPRISTETVGGPKASPLDAGATLNVNRNSERARKPSCSKWRSLVNTSVKPECRMVCIEMQSVRL